MCKGVAEQPLFEGCCSVQEMADDSPAAIRKAGKSLQTKLIKIRQSLGPNEALFLAHINECLEAVRAYSRFSDTQREELVLWAIEKSQATNVTEISEDTRLDPSIVKEILKDLHARDIVYQVKRYIPGSDRQYYLLKSRRVQNVEATTEFFAVEKNDAYATAGG